VIDTEAWQRQEPNTATLRGLNKAIAHTPRTKSDVVGVSKSQRDVRGLAAVASSAYTASWRSDADAIAAASDSGRLNHA
jgi:hypothetical protein